MVIASQKSCDTMSCSKPAARLPASSLLPPSQSFCVQSLQRRSSCEVKCACSCSTLAVGLVLSFCCAHATLRTSHYAHRTTCRQITTGCSGSASRLASDRFAYLLQTESHMYVINYALCAACRESPPTDVVYHFKGMFKRTRAGKSPLMSQLRAQHRRLLALTRHRPPVSGDQH
jgi:hypothetical protein